MAGERADVLAGAEDQSSRRPGDPGPQMSGVKRESRPPPSRRDVKVTARGRRPASSATAPARVLDKRPRRAAFGVDRGGVAAVVERLEHRRAGLGPQRRGGVVIEIGALIFRLRAFLGATGRRQNRSPGAGGQTAFFLAIAGRPRAKRPDPKPVRRSKPTHARRSPQARRRTSQDRAPRPTRRRLTNTRDAGGAARYFWRRNARSILQRPRRAPGRPVPSRQTTRRADRRGAAPAPAVRRHDEQPDRLQTYYYASPSAASTCCASTSAASVVRRAPSTTARASFRTPPARSTGRSRSARRRAPAGSPASRSAPGSACNC